MFERRIPRFESLEPRNMLNGSPLVEFPLFPADGPSGPETVCVSHQIPGRAPGGIPSGEQAAETKPLDMPKGQPEPRVYPVSDLPPPLLSVASNLQPGEAGVELKPTNDDTDPPTSYPQVPLGWRKVTLEWDDGWWMLDFSDHPNTGTNGGSTPDEPAGPLSGPSELRVPVEFRFLQVPGDFFERIGVDLDFDIDDQGNPISVPDGGTILIGGILEDGVNQGGDQLPQLGDVPYINRLFRNVGITDSSQELLIMVTPRIVVQQEAEE